MKLRISFTELRRTLFHRCYFDPSNNVLFPLLFFSTPTTPRERNFLPTIDVGKAGEDGSEQDPYSWRKNEYYRSMTSLVLERSSKNPESWVGDGNGNAIIERGYSNALTI